MGQDFIKQVQILVCVGVWILSILSLGVGPDLTKHV